MKYLIDSDWLIDTLIGHSFAAEVLTQQSVDGHGVSIITVGELFDGAYGRADVVGHLSEIRALHSNYAVLGLSEPTMEVFAYTRSSLRSRGQLIPDLDILIASTAIVHDLMLITRNVKHFERIEGLRLYSGDAD